MSDMITSETLATRIINRLKGGPGSGNFGHSGRPGLVGGSTSGKVGISGAPKYEFGVLDAPPFTVGVESLHSFNTDIEGISDYGEYMGMLEIVTNRLVEIDQEEYGNKPLPLFDVDPYIDLAAQRQLVAGTEWPFQESMEDMISYSDSEMRAEDVKELSRIELLAARGMLLHEFSKEVGYESSVVTNFTVDKEDVEIGTILIDAIYSPVKKVGYKVVPTRVGDITNYDKLMMEIETDGTITPEEAVEQSNKILIDHFALFAGDTKESEAK